MEIKLVPVVVMFLEQHQQMLEQQVSMKLLVVGLLAQKTRLMYLVLQMKAYLPGVQDLVKLRKAEFLEEEHLVHFLKQPV